MVVVQQLFEAADLKTAIADRLSKIHRKIAGEFDQLANSVFEARMCDLHMSIRPGQSALISRSHVRSRGQGAG